MNFNTSTNESVEEIVLQSKKQDIEAEEPRQTTARVDKVESKSTKLEVEAKQQWK